jgi:hypothetical protein
MIATIVRPLRGRIEIRDLRAPRGDEPTNKSMFKSAAGRRIRPTWVAADEGEPGWKGYWVIARNHLTVVAEEIAIRDGEVQIEMHYSTTEQCDRRCQEATGDECTCSCEGKYHGDGQHASWIEINEDTLVADVGEKVVMRTLSRAQAKRDRELRSDAIIAEIIARQRSASAPE